MRMFSFQFSFDYFLIQIILGHREIAPEFSKSVLTHQGLVVSLLLRMTLQDIYPFSAIKDGLGVSYLNRHKKIYIFGPFGTLCVLPLCRNRKQCFLVVFTGRGLWMVWD